MTDCVEILFCHTCESDEHFAAKCPLKRNKPVAYMVGYGVDNLGFFYIPHGPIPVSKKDNKMAFDQGSGRDI